MDYEELQVILFLIIHFNREVLLETYETES